MHQSIGSKGEAPRTRAEARLLFFTSLEAAYQGCNPSRPFQAIQHRLGLPFKAAANLRSKLETCRRTLCRPELARLGLARIPQSPARRPGTQPRTSAARNMQFSQR